MSEVEAGTLLRRDCNLAEGYTNGIANEVDWKARLRGFSAARSLAIGAEMARWRSPWAVLFVFYPHTI
jgi:hypothetical protein